MLPSARAKPPIAPPKPTESEQGTATDAKKALLARIASLAKEKDKKPGEPATAGDDSAAEEAAEEIDHD